MLVSMTDGFLQNRKGVFEIRMNGTMKCYHKVVSLDLPSGCFAKHSSPRFKG